MEQMADETTPRADVKDDGGEGSSTWARQDRVQTGAQISDWTLGADTGESGRDDSSLSSSQQSNAGVDCAGMVLNCLFCRFYDLFHMLPDSCENLANHCCPSYTHIISAMEAAPSDDEPWIDLDCGLFNSCQDASDCLELAMEVSELCYH